MFQLQKAVEVKMRVADYYLFHHYCDGNMPVPCGFKLICVCLGSLGSTLRIQRLYASQGNDASSDDNISCTVPVLLAKITLVHFFLTFCIL